MLDSKTRNFCVLARKLENWKKNIVWDVKKRNLFLPRGFTTTSPGIERKSLFHQIPLGVSLKRSYTSNLNSIIEYLKLENLNLKYSTIQLLNTWSSTIQVLRVRAEGITEGAMSRVRVRAKEISNWIVELNSWILEVIVEYLNSSFKFDTTVQRKQS